MEKEQRRISRFIAVQAGGVVDLREPNIGVLGRFPERRGGLREVLRYGLGGGEFRSEGEEIGARAVDGLRVGERDVAAGVKVVEGDVMGAAALGEPDLESCLEDDGGGVPGLGDVGVDLDLGGQDVGGVDGWGFVDGILERRGALLGFGPELQCAGFVAGPNLGREVVKRGEVRDWLVVLYVFGMVVENTEKSAVIQAVVHFDDDFVDTLWQTEDRVAEIGFTTFESRLPDPFDDRLCCLVVRNVLESDVRGGIIEHDTVPEAPPLHEGRAKNLIGVREALRHCNPGLDVG